MRAQAAQSFVSQVSSLIMTTVEQIAPPFFPLHETTILWKGVYLQPSFKSSRCCQLAEEQFIRACIKQDSRICIEIEGATIYISNVYEFDLIVRY